MSGRAHCWSIPSERIACLLWVKYTYPTGWRAIWQRIARAWRHA